jgi:hypothetical protein
VVVELGGMGWRYIEVELGICHRSLEGFARGDIVSRQECVALGSRRVQPCRAVPRPARDTYCAVCCEPVVYRPAPARLLLHHLQAAEAPNPSQLARIGTQPAAKASCACPPAPNAKRTPESTHSGSHAERHQQTSPAGSGGTYLCSVTMQPWNA